MADTIDKVLDQLVDHITRYLEQDGVDEDKVRKALEPNELEEGVFDQALSVVRAREEEKKEKERQEKQAAEDAAKEAAERKRKRLEAKSEAKRNSAKKASQKEAAHDKHRRLEMESSADAEALPQDTAISLHDPPKPKAEPLPEIIVEHSKTKEAAGMATEPASGSTPPASPTDKPAAVTPPAPTELSFTEELLGMQAPWDATRPQTPIVGQAEPYPTPQYQQPGAWPTAAQPQLSPYQNAYSPITAYSSSPYPAAPINPNKYPVLQAATDSFTAARGNLATYIVAVVLAFFVAGATFFLVALMINKFFVLPYSSLLATPTKLFVSIAGSIVLYALWFVLAGAFTIATTSLALFDGSQSHISTIGAILSKSLARMARVCLAVGAFGLIAFSPIALVALIPVFAAGLHGVKSLAYLLPTFYLAASAWAIAISTRYSLVPYVALFERSLPMAKAMERSKHLLSGSQPFLVKGSLPIVAFAGISALIIHYRPQAISHPSNIVINLLLLVIGLIANGAMVMLYCNRKLFRG
jgi:hypothetical protein